MENKKSFCASAILLCITFPAVSQLRDTGVGTVIDTASGLMWLKDAGCFSLSTWYDAKANVSALNTHGAGQGCYEYTGAYRDWRLPTREEFDSLTDPTQSKPALPAGHPFRNVDASSNWGWYWTSSAYGSDPEKAWMIGMAYGQWMPGFKQNYGNTLPVRTHVEAPTGPSFSFSSGSLVFEDTQVNSRSASRTIAVTNTGAATKILSVYASEDFPLSGTCVGSMATGTSCTISVAFQPTRAGHFSAPMTISTTDGQLDGPMLSGNAFAATEGGTEFKTPVQITMKTTHACGVDGNGVLCWGSNDSGQLQTPSGLVRPSQVAAGYQHSCALDANGVACWGAGTSAYSSSEAAGGDPTRVPDDLLDPIEVDAGGDHSCAIDKQPNSTLKSVRCWGREYSGGVAETPSSFTDPKRLSLGNQHSCVIDAGKIRCWGIALISDQIPSDISNPTEIASGPSHACAIAGGRVRCWGDDFFGQASVPYGLRNPSKIAAGRYHTCAIDGDEVRCWGEDYYNALIPPRAFSKPSQITVGDKHTCVLDDVGVTCWGDDREVALSQVPERFAVIADSPSPGGGSTVVGQISIAGNVRTGSRSLCAMVLVNGNYGFSCGDNAGEYSLQAPTDANGKLTIFAFADGLAPYKQVLSPTSVNTQHDVYMSPPTGNEKVLWTSVSTRGSTQAGKIGVVGQVLANSGGICGMVLANGVHAFSCGARVGDFEMEVPLDSAGHVNLFVFADSYKPYKTNIRP